MSREDDHRPVSSVWEHAEPYDSDLPETAYHHSLEPDPILHELILTLFEIEKLEDALDLCLRAAIRMSGMDSGGIYLVDAQTGSLELVSHYGLSDDFVKRVSSYEADSDRAQRIRKAKSLFTSFERVPTGPGIPFEQEQLRAIAILPVRYHGKVIACLNVSSHTVDCVEEAARKNLEMMAAHVGSALVRIRAEESRRASEQKYRLLVEQSPFGVIIMSSDGTIIDANGQTVEIFEIPLEKLIGTNGALLFSKRDQTKMERVLSTLAENKKQSGLVLDTSDGKVIRVNVMAFEAEAPMVYATLENISEQRRLEQQFQQAQKMEAIGRLAGGVAHDMNNVLGAVMGAASMLKLETTPGDPRVEDVDTILSACRKGRALTRDLLGFARKGKYIKEIISLNDVVDECQALLRHTIPKKILVSKELDSSLQLIEGDKSQIGHALMNICINAADAMSGEGDLKISTRNLSLQESPEAAFRGFRAGSYVEMKIEDNGVGMDPDTLERVFEPFFTTKEKGHGTGLGLSMAYGVVKNHDGIITIESEQNQGTTVTLFLPACADGKENIKTEQREEREPSPKKAPEPEGVVLIVDDEAMIRNSVKRLLEKMGYVVLTAASGREALKIYDEQQSEISLVILDLIMPEMDGTETFYALRNIDAGVRILLSSGYSKDNKVEKLLKSGATGFVSKPFDLKGLSDSIAKALN